MAEANRDDVIEQLAELERGAAERVSSEFERNLSRQRFLARVDRELEHAPSPWPSFRWWAPAVGVACVAVALVLWRSPALTFEVLGAELSGKYVSAPESRPVELRFSDDSKVVAAAGSRLRVEETTARGARVLLERGTASVEVVHHGSTAWSFTAGPFEVGVTGTRFDLTWDPTLETCELLLHEGSVEVRGPTGSGPMVVRGGQRFEGDARRRVMQVLELTAAATPAAAAPVQPDQIPAADSAAAPAASGPETEAEAATAPATSARPEPKAATWSARIAQGKFEEIVRDAEARGISSCLAGCSAADLRALSDAARYTGNNGLAEQTLTSLRLRFPGQAAEAAFLLGRLHEKSGAMGVALTWYDRYLSEASQGAFAAEALAGKLRAVKTTQGRDAAQPLAREYLKRFPKGVHVNTAREILGDP